VVEARRRADWLILLAMHKRCFKKFIPSHRPVVSNESESMNDPNETNSDSRTLWGETAAAACRGPLSAVACPVCGAHSVSGEWNLLSARTRETSVDLHCSACGARENVRIALPDFASACWPLTRFQSVADAVEKEAESLAARIRQHVQSVPAARFTTHPLWAEAKWSATTYKWHPTGDSPPIMGLVFDNAEAGMQIFRDVEGEMSHEDRFEEIRISIIEGRVPGQEHQPGYSVHICADPEALAGHATMDGFVVDSTVVPFLGQWNRHYPVPGAPPLLPKFKEEFARHKEFMLAPAVHRTDGKLYMEPSLGIIKNVILFRDLAEINPPEDTDAAAMLLPQFITPPPQQACGQ
jgi:hypothetical protein